MPRTNELYLAIKSEFFVKDITGYTGKVLDCYIGVARDGERKFWKLSEERVAVDQDTSDEESLTEEIELESDLLQDDAVI